MQDKLVPMVKKSLLSIFFLLLLLLPCMANARNWYVDKDASGSNNGTSWANAWRSFSSVVWGPRGVKAGDTLYISGGRTSKTYSEMWSVDASGTNGNPITIAVDPNNASHNGVVIFDYDSLGDEADGEAINCSESYIAINGNVNGNKQISVRNLRDQIDSIDASAIRGDGGGHITIQSVEVINCNNGFYFTSSSDSIEIKNCSIQVRGDMAVAVFGSANAWDQNLVHDNEIELLFNNSAPPGQSGYAGPDGVQCGSGMSIYNNTFCVTKTTSVYTSSQHPDCLQVTGNYIKVYNNEFINIGDSAFDFDCWDNSTPHDVRIYNNVFRITSKVDDYPEYFRMYTSRGAITSITNFKILNNTFIDNDDWAVISFRSFGGHPSGSGNEIKNNIFYNCGNGRYKPVIHIDDSNNFTGNSWDFDGNLYYHPQTASYIAFRGTNYTAPRWVSGNESNGTTNQPTFVSYTEYGGNNDLHLGSADTAAKDRGLDLSLYYTTDHNGVSRPQGFGWDIGAFER